MLKREQIKVLNDQLQIVRRDVNFHAVARNRFPPTKTERNAQAVLRQGERQRDKFASRLNKHYAKLYQKARTAIYFGTEKEATAAVNAVAKFVFDTKD